MAASKLSRRQILSLAGGAVAAPFILGARETSAEVVIRHNMMSYATQDWRDHFGTPGKATIIADETLIRSPTSTEANSSATNAPARITQSHH